ncbi:hypothetical protein VTO42DRAFT_2796 [Malbranchea cinnamomea]
MQSRAPSPGPAPTRLRQIALVAKDLKKAEHLLTTVLRTEVIFVDPGVEKFGLRNILVAIGGDVIEVVSPFKAGTTAGRLLAKRGDGGYMIIMQTVDAQARREYIESRGLAKVIYVFRTEESVGVQYHPKGIKGGMMPSLDSHTPTTSNPSPITPRFSPWHACGPDYDAYSAGMRRCAHLRLLSAVCRLAPGDADVDGALEQWQRLFGVKKRGKWLEFTNAKMGFEAGSPISSDSADKQGKTKEGLVSITIAAQGEGELEGIFDRARKCGVSVNASEGWVDMIGVRWYFVPDVDGAGDVVESSRL